MGGKRVNKLNKSAQKQINAILLLSDGNKHTAMEISFRLHISDPRSTIRDIRERGIDVKDEWCEENGCRFKRYWIENSLCYGG